MKGIRNCSAGNIDILSTVIQSDSRYLHYKNANLIAGDCR